MPQQISRNFQRAAKWITSLPKDLIDIRMRPVCTNGGVGSLSGNGQNGCKTLLEKCGLLPAEDGAQAARAIFFPQQRGYGFKNCILNVGNFVLEDCLRESFVPLFEIVDVPALVSHGIEGIPELIGIRLVLQAQHVRSVKHEVGFHDTVSQDRSRHRDASNLLGAGAGKRPGGLKAAIELGGSLVAIEGNGYPVQPLQAYDAANSAYHLRDDVTKALRRGCVAEGAQADANVLRRCRRAGDRDLRVSFRPCHLPGTRPGRRQCTIELKPHF
jgi:hypothetical protein